MLRTLKLFFAGVILAAGFTGLVCADVEVGKAAPDFSLTDSNGQVHLLSQYKGKFVVLEWLNYDCPFVKKHYNSGNMQTLQKAYTDKSVVWLSIISSVPGKEGYYEPVEVNKMSTEKGASPTAVLLDPQGEAGRLYGAQTTPHMFIVNPEGNVIYQGAIDDIKSADIEDVAKAKNYVQIALDEALSGKAVTTASTKSYGCSIKY